MVEVTCEGYRVKKHPTLGVWVREDGAVWTRATRSDASYRWYFGNNQGRGYKRFGWNGSFFSIHRTVAETFLPNPDHKPTVDHIDRDPSNNSVWNLRWATYKDQVDNTAAVDNELSKFGIRCCEEPAEYSRRRHKAYYEENKESINKSIRDKYHENIKESRRKAKEYREKNHEKWLEQRRRYREAHREEIRAYARARYARKIQNKAS